MFTTCTTLSCCDVGMVLSMLLSGVAAQMHIASAATASWNSASPPCVSHVLIALCLWTAGKYLNSPPRVHTSPFVNSVTSSPPSLGSCCLAMMLLSMSYSTLRFTSNLEYSVLHWPWTLPAAQFRRVTVFPTSSDVGRSGCAPCTEETTSQPGATKVTTELFSTVLT